MRVLESANARRGSRGGPLRRWVLVKSHVPPPQVVLGTRVPDVLLMRLCPVHRRRSPPAELAKQLAIVNEAAAPPGSSRRQCPLSGRVDHGDGAIVRVRVRVRAQRDPARPELGAAARVTQERDE